MRCQEDICTIIRIRIDHHGGLGASRKDFVGSNDVLLVAKRLHVFTERTGIKVPVYFTEIDPWATWARVLKAKPLLGLISRLICLGSKLVIQSCPQVLNCIC